MIHEVVREITGAWTNQKFEISGHVFAVFIDRNVMQSKMVLTPAITSPLGVRIDEPTNELIWLHPAQKIERPFKRLYITHPFVAAETLSNIRIIYGDEKGDDFDFGLHYPKLMLWVDNINCAVGVPRSIYAETNPLINQICRRWTVYPNIIQAGGNFTLDVIAAQIESTLITTVRIGQATTNVPMAIDLSSSILKIVVTAAVQPATAWTKIVGEIY